jgi:outer membrane lipopolysaccharide assembly protein LptE/RlpB
MIPSPNALGETVDRDQMWEELRTKVEASLVKRSAAVDAGMDRGV